MGTKYSVVKMDNDNCENQNGNNESNQPPDSRPTVKDVIKNLPKAPVNNTLYGLLVENKQLYSKSISDPRGDSNTDNVNMQDNVGTLSVAAHVNNLIKFHTEESNHQLPSSTTMIPHPPPQLHSPNPNHHPSNQTSDKDVNSRKRPPSVHVEDRTVSSMNSEQSLRIESASSSTDNQPQRPPASQPAKTTGGSSVPFNPKKRFRMRFEDSNKDTNDGDSVKSNPPTDTGNSVKSNPPTDTGNCVERNPPTDTGNKESNRTSSMGNKERTSSTDSVSAEASHYNTRIADAMDLHGSRLSPSTGTYVTDKYGNAKDITAPQSSQNNLISMRSYMDDMMTRLVKAPIYDVRISQTPPTTMGATPAATTSSSSSSLMTSSSEQRLLTAEPEQNTTNPMGDNTGLQQSAGNTLMAPSVILPHRRILTQNDLIQQKIREMLSDDSDAKTDSENGASVENGNNSPKNPNLNKMMKGVTPLTLISAQIEAEMRHHYVDSNIQPRKTDTADSHSGRSSVSSNEDTGAKSSSIANTSYPQLRLQLQGGARGLPFARLAGGSISKGTVPLRPDPKALEARTRHPDTVFNLVSKDIKESVFKASRTPKKEEEEELRSIRSNSWGHNNSKAQRRPAYDEQQGRPEQVSNNYSNSSSSSHNQHPIDHMKQQPESPENTRPASYHGHHPDMMMTSSQGGSTGTHRRASFSQSLRDAYFEKQNNLKKMMAERRTPSEERTTTPRISQTIIPSPSPHAQNPQPHHSEYNPSPTPPSSMHALQTRTNPALASPHHDDNPSSYPHRQSHHVAPPSSSHHHPHHPSPHLLIPSPHHLPPPASHHHARPASNSPHQRHMPSPHHPHHPQHPSQQQQQQHPSQQHPSQQQQQQQQQHSAISPTQVSSATSQPSPTQHKLYRADHPSMPRPASYAGSSGSRVEKDGFYPHAHKSVAREGTYDGRGHASAQYSHSSDGRRSREVVYERSDEDGRPNPVLFKPDLHTAMPPRSYGSITAGTPRTAPVVMVDKQRESILTEAYQLQSRMPHGRHYPHDARYDHNDETSPRHSPKKSLPMSKSPPPLMPIQNERHMRRDMNVSHDQAVRIDISERERSRSRSPLSSSQDKYTYKQPYRSRTYPPSTEYASSPQLPAAKTSSSVESPLDLSKKQNEQRSHPHHHHHPHQQQHQQQPQQQQQQQHQQQQQQQQQQQPSPPNRVYHQAESTAHPHQRHYMRGSASPSQMFQAPALPPRSAADTAMMLAAGGVGHHHYGNPPALEQIYQEEWLKHYRLPAQVEKQLHKEPTVPTPAWGQGQTSQNKQSFHPGDHGPEVQPADQRPAVHPAQPPPAAADHALAALNSAELGAQMMARYYSMLYPSPVNPSAAAAAMYAVHGAQMYKQQHEAFLSATNAVQQAYAANRPGQVSPIIPKDPEIHRASSPSPAGVKGAQIKSEKNFRHSILGDFPADDVLLITCNLCKNDCGNINSFMRHFRRDHPKDGEPQQYHVTIKSIRKAKHEKVVKSEFEVDTVDHMKKRNSESDKKDDSAGNSSKDEDNESVIKLKCFHCDQQFPTRDWGMFRRHMKSHDPPPLQQMQQAHDTMHCSDCHVLFKDKNEYQLHMSLCHKDHICVCKVCNVKFDNIDAMYKHVHTAHSGLTTVEVEFCCLHCNKSFTNERDLSEHRQTHNLQGRGSPGAHVSMSVKPKVRDQEVSMSPPNVVQRLTPDTTSEEEIRLPSSEPEMAISRSDSTPQETIATYTSSSTKSAPFSDSRQGNAASVAAAAVTSKTFFDMLQQKVEEEHKRQVRSPNKGELNRLGLQKGVIEQMEATESKLISNVLKRRLFNDLLTQECSDGTSKMARLDVSDSSRPQQVLLSADTIISSLVESALSESNNSTGEADELNPPSKMKSIVSSLLSLPIVSTPENIKNMMTLVPSQDNYLSRRMASVKSESNVHKSYSHSVSHEGERDHNRSPDTGGKGASPKLQGMERESPRSDIGSGYMSKSKFTDSDIIAATVLAGISGSGGSSRNLLDIKQMNNIEERPSSRDSQSPNEKNGRNSVHSEVGSSHRDDRDYSNSHPDDKKHRNVDRKSPFMSVVGDGHHENNSTIVTVVKKSDDQYDSEKEIDVQNSPHSSSGTDVHDNVIDINNIEDVENTTDGDNNATENTREENGDEKTNELGRSDAPQPPDTVSGGMGSAGGRLSRCDSFDEDSPLVIDEEKNDDEEEESSS